MKDDPIVEEIRRVRSAHAARYGNDLDRIFAAIKESEKKSTAKLVNREPILQSLFVPNIDAQISMREIVRCKL